MFQTPLKPHLLFSIVFLIFSGSILPSLSAEVDYRYANCAINSTCGPSVIKYPFWETKRPNYCGHRGFELDCQGDSLTIDITNQTYNVLNIDYSSYILTISNPAISNSSCPPTLTQLTNSTLDPTLFKLASSSQNATLFYDCSQASNELKAPYNFTCTTGGYFVRPTIIYAFLETEDRWKPRLGGLCKVKVYNPVLSAEVLRLSNKMSSIDGVLSKGFEVKWNVDDQQCDACYSSGGFCGYNYTLNQPICFCKDGASGKNCNDPETQLDQTPSPKNDSRRPIIIGLGVAASVSIILLGILCFLRRRLHKRIQSSPAVLAQNKTFSASSAASDFQVVNNSTYFGVQVLSYRELEEATENFNPLKELGDGGFGTVYHGKLGDGREVAIKRLYEHNNRRAEQFMNEVEILAHIRHKNLVALYGCTHRQSRELLLVYEYIPNGTVADHLHGRRAKQSLLHWATRLSIAIETAGALAYLHSSDIIHRDVKTQNILLDKEFSVKVADFGLSRLFPLDATHVSTAPQGTPGYVDPEYHQCYQLTEKSDVFSFGVVLAELISSKPAVDITRQRQDINLSSMAMNKIQNHALHEFVDPDLGFESDCKLKNQITDVAELAFRCLQSTSDLRPSMEEVLEILQRIQGQGNQVDKADEVDIPSDDAFMLKSDFSPTSPRTDGNFVRQLIPHASV
ncbi:hypothetical protein Cgig2_000607 [Carnegiea gigantea]|uniref:non-specific serine/threonine protein kinase n=1 Tax=Carnegiea gigantea TaxID=171969 RepID=A0A9Q1JNP0_9CARY|nr:hypothetical protein Cgig2_000607 [Carnegiea gigantea]